MKYVRRGIYALLLTAMMNYIPLLGLAGAVRGRAVSFTFWYWLPLPAAFLYINVRPLSKAAPTRRIQRLAEGAELLQLFLADFLWSLGIQMVYLGILFSAVIPTVGSKGIAIMIALPLVMVILALAV